MSEDPCIIYINKPSECKNLPYIKGLVQIIGDVKNSYQVPYPPIIRAAINVHDNSEVMKTLIEMGADVNAKDYADATALHRAAHWHRLKILEVLLELGADFRRTDWRGYTALHLAACSYERQPRSPKYMNDLQVTRALLRKKPDINARNEQGNTPLMEAVKGFNVDIVKELLEAGAEVGNKNKSGETCLHLLFNNTGKTDIMIELIRAGASLQAVDDNGNTPFKTFLRSVPMCKEKFEDIKILIKTALLVDKEVNENYYVNEDISNFVDECHAEVQEMRTIQFSGNLTLCDFAIRGSGISMDSVYEVMIIRTFKIYDNYIASQFERKYLCTKAVEKGIYTAKDSYDIVLPNDLVDDVCSFLSNIDLLNFLRVFTKCIPPNLKPWK